MTLQSTYEISFFFSLQAKKWAQICIVTKDSPHYCKGRKKKISRHTLIYFVLIHINIRAIFSYSRDSIVRERAKITHVWDSVGALLLTQLIATVYHRWVSQLLQRKWETIYASCSNNEVFIRVIFSCISFILDNHSWQHRHLSHRLCLIQMLMTILKRVIIQIIRMMKNFTRYHHAVIIW